MVNNFSVDQVGLYINWANTSLFIILGKLPTLNLPIKSHPSLRQLAIFSDVILVSNYHGCKEEAINYLIPHYLIDIIHKTVKPSHSEKLQIIQNINRLILIKQMIVSSTPFVLGETDFQKILPGVLSGGLGHRSDDSMHRFNAFFRNLNTIN